MIVVKTTTNIRRDNMEPEKTTKASKAEELANEIKLSIFDWGYKGDEFQAAICKILDVPDARLFEIKDVKGDLLLINISESATSAELKKYGYIHGLVLDMRSRQSVLGSFGHTPVAVADEILVGEDNMLHLTDVTKFKHDLVNDENLSITPVYEGVVVRIIWYGGRAYYMTHKKIDCSKSKWGDSATFLELYEKSGGPAPELLFDTSKQYSRRAYSFMIVDPTLRVGSMLKNTQPCCVFLGMTMLHVDFPVGVDVDELQEKNFESFSVPIQELTEPKVINAQSMTIEEANRFLKYGFYNMNDVQIDKRLMPGEAVLIRYSYPDPSTPDFCMRVQSTGFQHRVDMRGDDVNIVHRFYELVELVRPAITSQDRWDTICNRLVPLNLFDYVSTRALIEASPNLPVILSNVKEPTPADYPNVDDRIYLLYLNMLVATPITSRHLILPLIDNYHINRQRVIQWIQHLSKNPNAIAQDKTIPVRCLQLINEAYKQADRKIKDGKNFDSNNSKLSKIDLVNLTLISLINVERGPSLYSLIAAHRKHEKAAARAAVESTA